MKLKIRLFDGEVTAAQQSILILWAAVLVSVFALWSFGSSALLSQGLSQALLSIGRLLGLLATFFALTQFMLMGRVAWVERAFGLDRLASYHRFNGYMAIILILIHPVFIVSSYSIASHTNYIATYITTLQTRPYTIWALIAQILFVVVVGSSIYIARKRLSFETWYYVHVMVYLAIILVPFHQFIASPELAGSEFGRWYWIGVYAFVGLNILIWRFGAIAYTYLRYDFKIAKIVPETATVTSVYIGATKGNLKKFKIKPGQFILVRMLTAGRWWQEHPFTVSWIPKDNQLRLTIRQSGDYTNTISDLKKGTRVLVAGPFGRFTSDVRTKKKQLLIAGGVGITPIRALLEEAATDGRDTVVLFGNRDTTDVPLKAEIDALASHPHINLQYVYSDASKKDGVTLGRIDIAYLRQAVSDIASRDIYLCGPPPMTAGLVAGLLEMNIPSEQIHYEAFALHP